MKILFIFILLFLTGCRVKNKEDINILMPTGAPSLAQIKLENDYKVIDGYNIKIERVGDPKLLNSAFASLKYDLIYAPINIGVMHYNQNKQYKVLGSVTNGNIYFTSKNPLNDINDLNNKDLYIFGQGTINESIINYVLNNNNIKVNIKFLASTQDTLKQFINDKTNSIFLIAEPILSSKLMNITHYTLSVNDLLEGLGVNFIQAALFYKDGLDNHFLNEYYKLLNNSVNYVNNDLGVLEIIKNVDIGIPNNINLDIINKCNIKLTRLNSHILNKLIDLDPNKFKGKPDEAFYW